jgi:hypothetical protein
MGRGGAFFLTGNADFQDCIFSNNYINVTGLSANDGYGGVIYSSGQSVICIRGGQVTRNWGVANGINLGGFAYLNSSNVGMVQKRVTHFIVPWGRVRIGRRFSACTKNTPFSASHPGRDDIIEHPCRR